MPAGMCLSVRMWLPDIFHAAVAAEAVEEAIAVAEAVAIIIVAAVPATVAEAIDIDVCGKKAVLELLSFQSEKKKERLHDGISAPFFVFMLQKSLC